jgi:beta-galactosidase
MRGLKGGQPWLLLEQTPSQTQWRPINPLKRPGEMRLQSYQAIAHGSNGAMFFQWRQSRGAAEMYHGAIVSHAGHDQTRVFREVAQFGAELPSFGPALLESRVPARVALMFSWPIWWAVEFQPGLNGSISYLEEATRYFAALWGYQVAVDLITPDTPLGAYDLVVAPLLHMVTASQATAIEQYVAQGGAFLTTYFSGVIDTDARALLGGYPGPLRRTLGIWVEEFDPLLAGATNRVVVAAGGDLPVGSHTCDLWCEVVHCEGAQALATFGEDFYTGMPAVTRHAFGQGHSYYVATRPDAQLLHDLFGQILQVRGIQAPLPVPDLVEVVQRVAGEQVFTFLLNHQPDPQSVALPKPMRDILTGQIHTAAISLAGRGVAVLVEHAG